MTISIKSMYEFIQIAHKGQFDKIGVPYHLHPYSVMQRIPKELPDYVKISALGHDLIEDTFVTEDLLSYIGVPKESISIIKRVTRPKDSTNYMSWIDEIIDSNDYNAIIVKLADNFDNSSPNRIPKDEEQRKQVLSSHTRYAKARIKLFTALPSQYHYWFMSQISNPY